MSPLRPLVVIAALGLAACAGPRRTWENTQERDDRAAYVEFVTTWPDHELSAEARRRIDDLDWGEAQAADTSAAYQAYLRKQPEGAHRDEAQEAAARVELAEAREKGRTGLEAFLGRHRDDGILLEEAQADLELAIWEEAVAEDTPAAFRRYLQRFPEGRYAYDAEISQELSAFEEARIRDTPHAYQYFLNHNPSSHYAPQAWNRLKQLRFDTLRVVVAVRGSASESAGAVAELERTFAQHLVPDLERHGLSADLQVVDARQGEGRDTHPFDDYGLERNAGLLLIEIWEQLGSGTVGSARVSLYSPARRSPVTVEELDAQRLTAFLSGPRDTSGARSAVARAVASVRLPLSDYREP